MPAVTWAGNVASFSKISTKRLISYWLGQVMSNARRRRRIGNKNDRAGRAGCRLPRETRGPRSIACLISSADDGPSFLSRGRQASKSLLESSDQRRVTGRSIESQNPASSIICSLVQLMRGVLLTPLANFLPGSLSPIAPQCDMAGWTTAEIHL